MRPADEVEVVLLQEAGHHVLAKGEGHAAVVLAPPHDVLVGVRPEQVAEEARVFWVVVVGLGWVGVFIWGYRGLEGTQSYTIATDTRRRTTHYTPSPPKKKTPTKKGKG